MVVGSQWHVGQVFFSMLWFFLFIIWIWLLIMVFVDIFRSHDLGGFAKALWVLFLIFLPYLGVFVYLIARGHKMAEHAQQTVEAQDLATKAYIRDAVTSSPADELAKLADLRAQDVITEDEYQSLKAKIVS